MQIYVGQTRSEKLIEYLSSIGFGECTVRGEFPPRRTPYFVDNGAYLDFKEKKPFNEKKWAKCLSKLQASNIQRPAFVVCPDIVAGGMESLAFSKSHLASLKHLNTPIYLAVQDGMNYTAVAANLHLFDGIFVGGTTKWKENTAETWVEIAHDQNKPCHIGRCGTPRKVWWAKRINAIRVDSSYPLWCAEHLKEFEHAINNDPEPSAQFDFFNLLKKGK